MCSVAKLRELRPLSDSAVSGDLTLGFIIHPRSPPCLSSSLKYYQLSAHSSLVMLTLITRITPSYDQLSKTTELIPKVIVSGLKCLGGGSKKNIFLEWSKSARKSIMILAFNGFALKCFLKNVSF